jgi:hypothetical protein
MIVAGWGDWGFQAAHFTNSLTMHNETLVSGKFLSIPLFISFFFAPPALCRRCADFADFKNCYYQ